MQDDYDYDALTIRAPQRTRWYTRLWPACLGHGCCGRKTQQFPLFLIGYDPVGQFQRAASVGDVAAVERFINGSFYHVNECDRRGRTSLHYASAHNHPNVVTLLSSNDYTDINIQDDEGCTPLIKATQRDNIECVSVLLRHGADPHIMDFNGDAALHHAVCRGNVAIASILLEYKANVNAKTEYGLTPYKLALYEQQHEMAEFLIKNGADAHSECTPNSGGTAAEESEQTEKKYANFNKEENFSTDPMPSCSAVRPAGELKSILKKSIQISGDNGRNKDQLSLRFSENPDVSASITEDKASTSDIKEDIENSSCRYTIIQKQNFCSKKIAAMKKREQAVLYKSLMDVEKKNTDSFVRAAYPHDVVPQPLAHADSISSHASDRGDALDPAENAADPTDHTMNTHSMVFPIGTANMLLLLLASIIWLVKFVRWVMMWVLNLF